MRFYAGPRSGGRGALEHVERVERGEIGARGQLLTDEAEGQGDTLGASGSVLPGMEVYQLTKNGIALQATVQGTKYWKDPELN
ncbi:MAG: hypothetical protein ACO3DQ_04590 [Cephaloticoccus sp.]